MSSSVSAASEAEKAFNQEVLACASYYQIASEAIANMNAPQMQAVGERLKGSALQAIALAEKYQSSSEVAALLEEKKSAMLSSIGDTSRLGPLMGKYKTPCQNLLAQPQQRLDYWTMATM